jgi:hypothetical protein
MNTAPTLKKKNKYRNVIIIAILVSLAVWEKRSARVIVKPPGSDTLFSANDLKVKAYQYKTINVPDSTHQLLAYEFHAYKGDGHGADYSCSAIIKKIDPAKDNYKLYSRAVIADIINTMNTDDIEVNIYDDYNAFVLAEQNNGNVFKLLTKAEEDSVCRHTVATYDTRERGWATNIRTITYYAQAGNKYTGQEPYE